MKHSVLFWIILNLGYVTRAVGNELIAGWEGEKLRGYGFFAAGIEVFQVHHSSLLMFRGTGSYLYYNIKETQSNVSVTSPGASISALFRWSNPQLTFTAGGGLEKRLIRRQPEDGVVQRSSEFGFVGQADVFYQVARLTNLNFIFSYGGANKYIWSRAGIKHQFTNTTFTGPLAMILGTEITAQGNRDVRSYQLGALLELSFLRAGGSLQLRGGLSRLLHVNGVTEMRAYAGIGMYLSF